jgi:predicted amidohydrolase YtcJ
MNLPRRTFLQFAGAAVAAPAASQIGSIPARAQSAARPADAIFRGGPILTMNDGLPRAEALAVKEGKIVAVGAWSEVEGLAGPRTRTVELQGRTLIPGFVDSHSHVFGIGFQASVANLLPAPDGEGNDIAALQRVLTAWESGPPSPLKKYGWIVGLGYDDSQLKEQRHPNRDDLDKVSNDKPVLVLHQSFHLGAVNSKALEVLGVTAATADPNGGVYRRRPGSREPDGVLEERANFARR